MSEQTTETKTIKKIEGKNLVPDLTTLEKETRAGMYWVGARPTMPLAACYIGGVIFPHTVVTKMDDGQGGTIESTYFGSLRNLRSSQVKSIVNALPRLVIRYTDAGKERIAHTEDIDENGNPIRLVGQPIRKGFVIQIPDERAKEVLIEQGRYREYIPQPGDEPLANHIYMVKTDARGGTLPPPVSETGIEE